MIIIIVLLLCNHRFDSDSHKFYELGSVETL